MSDFSQRFGDESQTIIITDESSKRFCINKDSILVISMCRNGFGVKISNDKNYVVTDFEKKREILGLVERRDTDFVKISEFYINITKFRELSGEGIITFSNETRQGIHFDKTTSFESAITKINSALAAKNFRSQTQR